MDRDELDELPAGLRQGLTRYNAPPGLRRRIRFMLEQPHQNATAPQRPTPRLWRQQWAPMAASFACGALLAFGVLRLQALPSGDDDVEQQVVASHVHSLMGDHLTDVASSDRHAVKPWFSGKLAYAPKVVDLAQDGFPLVGGRLDSLQHDAVAALVYRRRQHTINLFVLPARRDAPASKAVRFMVSQGFEIAAWSSEGMQYWAVSDLGREELAKFVRAIQAAS